MIVNFPSGPLLEFIPFFFFFLIFVKQFGDTISSLHRLEVRSSDS